MPNTTNRAAALVAATVLTLACQDGSTGLPDPTSFDAAETQANLDAMRAVLATGAWESFRALGPHFTAGTSAVAAGGVAEAATRGDFNRAAHLAGRLALYLEPRRVPGIPPEIRGTTFVLDPETLRYVADPERDGAPANGVRFVLYAVNPVSHQPIVDTEIGHADLTDAGDALENGVAVLLEVVSGDVTFLEYAVSAVGTETSGTLTVAGFTTNGDTRLDFDIVAEGNRSGAGESMEVRFDLAIPGRGFAAQGRVTGAAGDDGSSGDIELMIEVGDAVIAFTAHGTPDTIDAAFHVNGNLLATVSGDPASPNIRGEGGRELTQEERHVLRQIMQITGHMFQMFDRLMQPVGAILGFHQPQ